MYVRDSVKDHFEFMASVQRQASVHNQSWARLQSHDLRRRENFEGLSLPWASSQLHSCLTESGELCLLKPQEGPIPRETDSSNPLARSHTEDSVPYIYQILDISNSFLIVVGKKTIYWIFRDYKLRPFWMSNRYKNHIKMATLGLSYTFIIKLIKFKIFVNFKFPLIIIAHRVCKPSSSIGRTLFTRTILSHFRPLQLRTHLGFRAEIIHM